MPRHDWIRSRSCYRKTALVAYSLLIFAIGTAFWPGLSGKFISDDWPVIVENEQSRSIASVTGFFTTSVWANTALGVPDKNLYRPVHLLWNFVNKAAFGNNPFAFHATTLLLHALNAFLVVCLIGAVFPDTSLVERILGAAFFAVHPLQVECVSWISGATDVVMAAPFIGALLSYFHYRSSGGKILYLLLTLFLLSAALLTKETAVVWIAVVIVYDLVETRGFRSTPRRKFFVAYGAFFTLILCYLLCRSLVLHDPGAESAFLFSPDRFLRFGEFLILAFRFILAPWPQPFYFVYPEEGIAGGFDLLLGSIGLGGLLLLGLRLPRSRFPIVWIVAPLLPPLALAFRTPGSFALRNLYLPTVGLGLCLAIGMISMRGRGYRASCSLIAVLLLLFVGLTARATRDWQDEEAFFEKVIVSNPRSGTGYEGLADHYQRIGEPQAAIAAYKRGLSALTDPAAHPQLAEGLGLLYGSLGMFPEGLRAYELLMENPETRVISLVGVGNSHWMLGDHPRALAAYREAIRLDEQNFDALYNYGVLNEALGNLNEAEDAYRKLLQLNLKGANVDAVQHARGFVRER